MKKVIVIIAVVLALVLLFGGLWYSYSKLKRMELVMSNIIGENYYLKDSFNNLSTVNYISVDSVWLKHGQEAVELSKVVSFPCLIIYLPSVHEDVCNSCIDYAINEAMRTFKNFSNSRHICLVSIDFNPEIKERVYKKKCYFVDKALLDVPQVNMPYYFILNKDGSVEFLFAPNSLFKEYTALYWKQLNQKFKEF